MRSNSVRRAVALATTGMLGVAGGTVAATTGGGAAAAASSSVDWGTCSDELLATAGAQCGFVTVPLDWSKPSGKKIKVRVSKMAARSSASKRQGVVLVNPGGPGGSGLVWPAILQGAVPGGVGKTYDWIGFDPRGVGESRPALSCDPDYFVGPRPPYALPKSATSAISATEAAWIKRTKGYVADCAKNGDLLAHVKSIDTVRDMEAIRKALGEEQINYYGFSYGTFLGQAYATKYPNRVRRMVLDGNVPPTYSGYDDAGRSQMIGFEGVIDEFFAWVAKYDDIYHLGTDAKAVRATYDAEAAKLAKKPQYGIGAAELNDVFLLAGYAESRWTQVAAAFADLHEGHSTPISVLYHDTATPGDDNGYAAFNATLCTDGAFPKSYAKVRKDAYGIEKVAPFITWGSYWYSQPCTFWQTKAGTPITVDGSKTKSLLLVNATKDGATPYSGAIEVRKEFPAASLVAEVGATTHAGSLRGNKCVDRVIAKYLETGELPARVRGDRADVSCARGSYPVPSSLDRSLEKSSAGGLFSQQSLVAALLDNLTAYGRR